MAARSAKAVQADAAGDIGKTTGDGVTADVGMMWMVNGARGEGSVNEKPPHSSSPGPLLSDLTLRVF